MDRTIAKRRRIRLRDPVSERAGTWQELTDCVRDELLSPSQRRALGFPSFGWEHRYVPASVAANMLGVSTAQFRKLIRKQAPEIDQLEIKGRRLFLTRDVLLMKADLLRGRGTGVR